MQMDERLIMMANQIAIFFESQPENIRLTGVRDHINKFWEKRMRMKLVALAQTPAADKLHPLVRESIAHIF